LLWAIRSSGVTIKSFLKDIFDLVCILAVLPLYCCYRLLAIFGKKDRAFWGCSQLLSLFPGVTGNFLRKNFYRLSMEYCAKTCAILFGTLFSQSDTEIGPGVYIGPHCNIGKCRIEKNCTLGSGVHVMSGKQQHLFDSLEIPVQEQGGMYKKVRIGEDTWIGNGALIMADVGKKCVIGAGSVVTKEIEDCSIAVGNPARVVRKRSTGSSEP